CATDLKQVCSPFTSTGSKYCFLSCEDEDLRAADGGLPDGAVLDADEYCKREAHPDFICRSTGGGAENRRVCVPGGAGGDGGPPGDGGGGPPGTDAGPTPEAGASDASLDAT